jgi:glycerol-3-phosphate dehydrogenase
VPELRLERRLTGFSKGVHLVTRQLEPEYAVAMTLAKKTEGFVSRGGRHFFIIPWRGCSLIGTTNVPFTDHLDRIRVSEADIIEFLADINSALPEVRLTREDVRYAFCGIYPLIARDIRTDTYQGTGEYQVIDHERANGIKGIITALGAKYTTARHVAERSVDLAMRKLERRGAPCLTAKTRLLEGAIESIEEFRSQCHQAYGRDLSPQVLDAMIANHGTEVHDLVAEGQRLNLLQPSAGDREVLDIEVRHAVRAEMAMTLDDLIFRRTGLGTIGHPGSLAVQRCAELMGALLNWDDAERERQIALVAARYRFA